MTNKYSSKKYLLDVLTLAFSAFGGPQAHVAMLFETMVDERKYVTENELIELNALCQILPGPTSTQTITALGYKLGGFSLAAITLLIWLLPAAIGMISIAIGLQYLQEQQISLEFLKYIKPIAIGFICFAAFKLSKKIIKTNLQIILAVFTTIITTFILIGLEKSFLTALIFPGLLIIGGIISAKTNKNSVPIARPKLKIKWTFLILFLLIFIGLSVGAFFINNHYFNLADQFYRSGSMIFGGGDVLIPFLQGEFVETKKLLTNEEFLNGYAMVRAMPGPMFSFCGYLGAMSSPNNAVLGGLIGIGAIFLPGTLLIFFLIDFWDELKKFPEVKNSLAGITAVSVGLITCAALVLLIFIINNTNGAQTGIDLGIVSMTFILLLFTKIPSPLLIIIGIGAGFI